ncbi:dienelactone hydrolase family protein [Cohnella hashimotonis]|uniref:Alpha/beta hydrolase family protein n=1 Tax=Cohnella hashimotonis TaxID=2826895 RepID=A0ABT6TM52_9BACL|nr:alpha/beta hydrolase family protein [Cohnella hashimotonis]MDI4647914.1 alpha/beta hydrolase family protein [Cohnella hashimotonis]
MKLEHYLDTLKHQAAEKREARGLPITDEARGKLIETFGRLLGAFPETGDDPQPQLLERVACDGYTRELVEIGTVEGLRMRVYVLVPTGADSEAAKLPAVIALHGHGYGAREIVGLEPDGSERAGAAGLHKDFAVSLARQGFVAIAPELAGFGDRRLNEDIAQGPGQSSCFRLAVHLFMTGRTLAGLRVRETKSAIDYAQSRAEVDPSRIGIMGISGGGLVAGFAAALDPRICCAVVSGYASLFEESILDRNHCLDNYIPGLLPEAEMPDLLGLIAPRGLFLESGDTDRVFPREPALKAYEQLKRLYGEAGATEAVQADFFEGGHEIHGEPAYAWLRKQLRLTAYLDNERGA